MGQPSEVSAARAGTAAVATTIASVVPVFLAGGLAVQVTDDLDFSAAGLGLAVAAYFAVSGLCSILSGRVVEHWGVVPSARAAIVIAATGQLAVAAFAHDYWTFMVLLALTGPANSLGQLAANAMVSRRVPAGRQGLIFGIKQAAIPLSTLLAGLSVPVLALTVGWRWAFVAAAVLACAALPMVPGGMAADPAVRARRPKWHRPSLALVLITIAGLCGSGAANPLSSFLTDFAVSEGMSPGLAGVNLTVGGLVGVAARITVGWLADRRDGGRLTMIAVMLATGASSMVIMAMPQLWLIPIATVLGFGLGWAWPGLLNFAVTRTHPDAPAAATGVTQTGVYLGGAFGPLGFGLIVDTWNYRAAWLSMAVALGLGAVLMVIGRRLLLRNLGR